MYRQRYFIHICNHFDVGNSFLFFIWFLFQENKLKPELRKFSIFILYSSNDSWRKLMRQKSMRTLDYYRNSRITTKLKWWWNWWSYNATVTCSYCHSFKNFTTISSNSYINSSRLYMFHSTTITFYTTCENALFW